jgi:hypothetical protein
VEKKQDFRKLLWLAYVCVVPSLVQIGVIYSPEQAANRLFLPRMVGLVFILPIIWWMIKHNGYPNETSGRPALAAVCMVLLDTILTIGVMQPISIALHYHMTSIIVYHYLRLPMLIGYYLRIAWMLKNGKRTNFMD